MSGIHIVKPEADDNTKLAGVTPRWVYNSVRIVMLFVWLVIVVLVTAMFAGLFTQNGLAMAKHFGGAVPEDLSVLLKGNTFVELILPLVFIGLMAGFVLATKFMDSLTGGLTGDDRFWKFVLTSYDRVVEQAIRDLKRLDQLAPSPVNQ